MIPIDNKKMVTTMNGSSSLENLDDIDKPNVLIFEDKDYHNNILDNLNMLRKNKQFCDVILQVSIDFYNGLHELSAHRTDRMSKSQLPFGDQQWVKAMTGLCV